MNKRVLGSRMELCAAKYLEQKGLVIVAHSFRCRVGEIDLICRDWKRQTIVFVEVKYRGSGRCGSGGAAVGAAKQRRICKTAAYYIASHGIPLHMPFRFDVIAFAGNELQWYENAFPYVE